MQSCWSWLGRLSCKAAPQGLHRPPRQCSPVGAGLPAIGLQGSTTRAPQASQAVQSCGSWLAGDWAARQHHKGSTGLPGSAVLWELACRRLGCKAAPQGLHRPPRQCSPVGAGLPAIGLQGSTTRAPQASQAVQSCGSWLAGDWAARQHRKGSTGLPGSAVLWELACRRLGCKAAPATTPRYACSLAAGQSASSTPPPGRLGAR
ncbi:Uncharacterised protein [Pseudomonas putida]|nr:Uncharacterised protein [Pseudomonas putida]